MRNNMHYFAVLISCILLTFCTFGCDSDEGSTVVNDNNTCEPGNLNCLCINGLSCQGNLICFDYSCQTIESVSDGLPSDLFLFLTKTLPESIMQGRPDPMLLEAQNILSSTLTPGEMRYLEEMRWLEIDAEMIVSDPVVLKALGALEPVAQQLIAQQKSHEIEKLVTLQQKISSCSTVDIECLKEVGVGWIKTYAKHMVIVAACYTGPIYCGVVILVSLAVRTSHAAETSSALTTLSSASAGEPADPVAYQRNVDSNYTLPTSGCSVPTSVRCDSICVDLSSVYRHCGSCGNICDSGQCNNGQCAPCSDVCTTGRCQLGQCTGCASDELDCGNGICISSNLRCDGTEQCGNGADERNCIIDTPDTSDVSFDAEDTTTIEDATTADTMSEDTNTTDAQDTTDAGDCGDRVCGLSPSGADCGICMNTEEICNISGECVTAPEAGTLQIFATNPPQNYRFIPPGTFMMGSPPDEIGRGDLSGDPTLEEQREVTISRGFWMKETEVTQGEWLAVMGYNPSPFPECGINCPIVLFANEREVISVYWDMMAYLNAISLSEGLSLCYDLTNCTGVPGVDYSCNTSTNPHADCTGYRLPTEEEWEYAARAGTITATYMGNFVVEPSVFGDSGSPYTYNEPTLDIIAWYRSNSEVSYYGNCWNQGSCTLTHPFSSHICAVRCASNESCTDTYYANCLNIFATDPNAGANCLQGITELFCAGPHPVRQKQPNPWGLYDILGNTSEAVQRIGILRGCGWNFLPNQCRSARRESIYLSGQIGFRPARSF